MGKKVIIGTIDKVADILGESPLFCSDCYAQRPLYQPLTTSQYLIRLLRVTCVVILLLINAVDPIIVHLSNPGALFSI